MGKINDVELVDISKLVPYVNNAKKHSDEQVTKIASSIKEFGFINPVLIDSQYGIIAGHGRVLGAKKLGLDKVPCLKVEGLTDAQRKAYILADNRLAEYGSEWDMELVSLELKDLDDMDFDINMLGFDEGDIFKDEESSEIKETEVPEIDEENVITPRGGVWQLGKHRLMCGDSTNQDDVKKLMNNQEADLLLTDPPYNVDYTGKTKDALKIENDKMDDLNFRQFLNDVFQNANMFMKDGAAFYIWHADSEGYNFRGACRDAGWNVRQCLIWNKNTLVMGRQDYHWKHEPCLYGWKDGAGHFWNSDRKQTTVLDFDRPNKNDIHPTMKPVALFDYQIKNNTKAGDIVLDLFGGSGTTIIACEQNGRKSYSMEYDPKYCDVIVKRWEQLTGEKGVLLND